MRTSDAVGRVGGLAFAIGVGIAIAAGCGAASADSTGSSPHSTGGGDTAASHTSVSAPTARTARRTGSLRVVKPAAMNPVVKPGKTSSPTHAPALLSLAGARRDAEQTAAASAPKPVTFRGEPSYTQEVFAAALWLSRPILKAVGLSLGKITDNVPIFSDGTPYWFATIGVTRTKTDYNGMTVWTLTPRNPSGETIVAVHGGGFVSQINLFQWATFTQMARDTGATVVVPLYPLGNATDPLAGADAAHVIPQMAEFIDSVITNSGGPGHVSVIGDSAGGNIALAAAEYVVRRNNDEHHVDDLALPGRIVLFSPALDLTYTDPTFQIVWDPWLALSTSKEHGKIWAGHLPLDSPLVSPVFGSLDGLPPITVFGGSIDLHAVTYLTFQDQVLAHNADPANASDQWDVTFELRRDLMHDWFIFPFLPDAVAIRPDVYKGLGLTVRHRTGDGVAHPAGA